MRFSVALMGLLLIAPAWAEQGGQPGIQQLTGDCAAGPGAGSQAVTCTKTNGTPFAPSATSDTTNASNITSGTLAAARGGAGTVNGALKGNGSGVVSQAACADLSNAGPACTGTVKAPMNFATGANSALSTTLTQFIGTVGVIGTEANAAFAMVPGAGTIKNLYCQLTNAGIASGSYAFVLRQNQTTSTALTCTVTSQTCNDTTHTVSVSAGDTFDIQSTPSSPSAGRIASCVAEFDPS